MYLIPVVALLVLSAVAAQVALIRLKGEINGTVKRDVLNTRIRNVFYPAMCLGASIVILLVVIFKPIFEGVPL